MISCFYSNRPYIKIVTLFLILQSQDSFHNHFYFFLWNVLNFLIYFRKSLQKNIISAFLTWFLKIIPSFFNVFRVMRLKGGSYDQIYNVYFYDFGF